MPPISAAIRPNLEEQDAGEGDREHYLQGQKGLLSEKVILMQTCRGIWIQWEMVALFIRLYRGVTRKSVTLYRLTPPQRESALFGGLRSVAAQVCVQGGAQEGRPLQDGQEARLC